MSLRVEGLTIVAAQGQQLVRDLSLEVHAGEIVGLVGESGSGKTMTALSLLGLLPEGVELVAGDAELDGQRFIARGQRLGRPDATMIFQDPTAALNPTMKIGGQLRRLLRFLDAGASRRERIDKAVDLLDSVGIRDPRQVMNRFPHQLSGGMNQRVMIAMAMAAEPRLLVADEPTTGLDVTVQAQILKLVKQAARTREIGVLLVSHDMGVVAQMCNRVAVMYRGEIREFAAVDEVFHAPTDAYTKELLASAMELDGMELDGMELDGMELDGEVGDGTRA